MGSSNRITLVDSLIFMFRMLPKNPSIRWRVAHGTPRMQCHKRSGFRLSAQSTCSNGWKLWETLSCRLKRSWPFRSCPGSPNCRVGQKFHPRALILCYNFVFKCIYMEFYSKSFSIFWWFIWMPSAWCVPIRILLAAVALATHALDFWSLPVERFQLTQSIDKPIRSCFKLSVDLGASDFRTW